MVATTVKLGRTLWLIPLAFVVGLIYRSSEAQLRVPGFILLFILAAVLGSFIPISDVVLDGFSIISKTLLVVALGMIGLEIDRATLSQISRIPTTSANCANTKRPQTESGSFAASKILRVALLATLPPHTHP